LLLAITYSYRFIVGFNIHKIAGSSGRPKWFECSPGEQDEHLKAKAKKEKGFKKVSAPFMVLQLIIEAID
jgi:hypothetical protein